MHIIKKSFINGLKEDQEKRFIGLLKTFSEAGFTVLLGEFEVPIQELNIPLTKKFFSLNVFLGNTKIQEFKRDAKEPGTVIDAMASFFNDFAFIE